MVAVFTIPDVQGRADPLAEAAEKDGVPVFKFPRWRSKGKPITSVSVCFLRCGYLCASIGVCLHHSLSGNLCFVKCCVLHCSLWPLGTINFLL